MGLQKQGMAVGASNAVTLTSYLKQLDGMCMDMKCDHCQVLQGQSDVPIRASSHHSVGRQAGSAIPSRECTKASGSCTKVRQSTSDTTGSRTRTVARHPTEGCKCVAWRTGDHTSKSEMDDAGSERGSVAYGGGCDGELAVSVSACSTCLFCEAEFVEDSSRTSLPDC